MHNCEPVVVCSVASGAAGEWVCAAAGLMRTQRESALGSHVSSHYLSADRQVMSRGPITCPRRNVCDTTAHHLQEGRATTSTGKDKGWVSL